MSTLDQPAKAARIACCVPFCRRTTAAGRFREWICPKHWPAVSLAAKTRKRKAERLALKARARAADPRNLELRFCARAAAAWERCKAEAIERAAGIS